MIGIIAIVNKYFNTWIDSMRDIHKSQNEKISVLKLQLKTQEKDLKMKYIYLKNEINAIIHFYIKFKLIVYCFKFTHLN